MQPPFVGKIKLKGSMTVEASFAVPLFIFCIINLLFGIQIMETSSRITAALHETGNEICSYGYAISESIGEGVPSGLASIVYASTSCAKHLGKTVDRRGGIKGGISGISYLGSSVMNENGIVKICASYSVKYPINMSIPSIRLGTTYYGHAWVGYDGGIANDNSDDEDPIVYITPNGTIYHRNIRCSHLNPSLKTVSAASINGLRSNDGSKYYPCEICGGGKGMVFITEFGNRYHGSSNCSGIKRNIYSVHLSEVGGRRACMTCGG